MPRLWACKDWSMWGARAAGTGVALLWCALFAAVCREPRRASSGDELARIAPASPSSAGAPTSGGEDWLSRELVPVVDPVARELSRASDERKGLREPAGAHVPWVAGLGTDSAARSFPAPSPPLTRVWAGSSVSAVGHGRPYVLMDVDGDHRVDGMYPLDALPSKPTTPVILLDEVMGSQRRGWRYIRGGRNGWLYIPIGIGCDTRLQPPGSAA